MHIGMLKTRAGFTLAEVLVALTLTAVLGATMTGAFMSQSRFFDRQEKVGAARSVSRGGTNMLLSELRMIETTGGVMAASSSSLTVRVPYAMGLFCKMNGFNMVLSQLPVDSVVLATAIYSGYAYRNGGTYMYPLTLGSPTAGTAGDCAATGIDVTEVPGGQVVEVPGGPALKTGTPVFLYQTVTYSFKASASVPGRLGLFREVFGAMPPVPPEEELVAPFAATAEFRYFDDYSGTSKATVSPLSAITGVEVRLDGLSERPNMDGTYQSVPHVLSVFFKNR